jgi:uncharacterized membrane protein
MFMVTGTAHFGSLRPDMVRMVPRMFPRPDLWVTFTGVAELLGAVGLLIPRLTRIVAAALSLLLIAVFPANVHAALEQLTFGDGTAMPLLPRTLLQVLFLAATVTCSLRPVAPHAPTPRIQA